MSIHETVHRATAAQLLEIAASLVQTAPNDLPFDRAQWLIGHKGEWTPDIQEILRGKSTNIDIKSLLCDWEEFYLDVFGLTKDFSALVIPPHQAGFDRLLVVTEGITPNRLFEACQKHFSSWRYMEDLDTVKSDRAPDHDYAVWVRDRREADEELKSRSADDLRDIAGITLEERLIYELKLFKETGEHLDVMNWTLCLGSRGPDGYVPGVGWDRASGEMHVFWGDPDDRGGSLRARAVVSA